MGCLAVRRSLSQFFFMRRVHCQFILQHKNSDFLLILFQLDFLIEHVSKDKAVTSSRHGILGEHSTGEMNVEYSDQGLCILSLAFAY